MTAHAATQDQSGRWPRLLAFAVVAIAALTGTLAMTSSAVFTDSATVSNNTFTAGTIDISTTPASSALTASGLMPGDIVYAPLTVQNAGSGQLRYSITSASTNSDTKDLRSALQVQIRANPSACTSGGFSSGAAVIGTNTALNGFSVGNPAAGSHTGDRVVNASVSEVLCFRIELPTSAGNTLQNATTTTTLTLAAEQTANN